MCIYTCIYIYTSTYVYMIVYVFMCVRMYVSKNIYKFNVGDHFLAFFSIINYLLLYSYIKH